MPAGTLKGLCNFISFFSLYLMSSVKLSPHSEVETYWFTSLFMNEILLFLLFVHCFLFWGYCLFLAPKNSAVTLTPVRIVLYHNDSASSVFCNSFKSLGEEGQL